MTGALAATILWAFCVVAASRSVRQLGSNEANFWRLLTAMLVTGGLSYAWGQGFVGPATFIFLLSGAVGFGLGDFGGFHAMPRIGARLTILFGQCVAAPIAAVMEWLWLGTTLTIIQLMLGIIILGGVTLALSPAKGMAKRSARDVWIGSGFGMLAALGQAGGAVLSRRGYQAAEASGDARFSESALEHLPSALSIGLDAAAVRLVGGLVFAGAILLLSLYFKSWQKRGQDAALAKNSLGQKIKWNSLHSLTGPILGIICFQWALASAPSGVVLPIVATTPIVTIPFAYWLEGDRPSKRSLLGGAIAVVAALALATISA
jgi:drug/metabolite transporter (DMT)-like permease